MNERMASRDGNCCTPPIAHLETESRRVLGRPTQVTAKFSLWPADLSELLASPEWAALKEWFRRKRKERSQPQPQDQSSPQENRSCSKKGIEMNESETLAVSTKALVDELRKRLGVSEVIVGPYEHEEITVDGPAIVLIVID